MAALTTVAAVATAAAAVASAGYSVATAGKKPKAPTLNADPGAVAANEARTDTGADIKLKTNKSANDRLSGKRTSAAVQARAGSSLGGLNKQVGVGF